MYITLPAVLVLASLALTGCSIQKPLYTKGLHVEWYAPNSKSSLHNQDKPENRGKAASFQPNDLKSEPLTDINELALINNPWEANLIASSAPGPVIVTQEVESAPSFKPRHQNPKVRAFQDSEIAKAETPSSESQAPDKKTPAPGNNGKKLEILSLLSMIFSIVGLFAPYAGFAFIVAGLVLGILGLLKFKKNPDMYWGRGFAIAGISVAAFAIFLLILLLALVGTLFLLAL